MSLRNPKGFTLIELLILIAVLGIFSITFYQLRSLNNLAQKNHIYEQKAVWVLQSQAEWVESLPYSKLKASSKSAFFDSDRGYQGLRGAQGTMEVKQIADDLKKIILAFDWINARQQKQTLTVTLYRHRI